MKIVISTLFLLFPLSLQDGCTFSFYDRLTEAFSQPLAFWEDSDELVYPPLENATFPYAYNNITINPGDFLTVSCVENGFNPDVPGVSPNQSTAAVFCDSQSHLRLGNEIIEFGQINCDNLLNLHLGTVNDTKFSCGETGELIRILLETGLSDHHYLPVVEICYDKAQLNILYVKYNATKNVIFKYDDITGTLFKDEEIFDIDLSRLYRFSTVQSTINALLSLPLNSSKYIFFNGNDFDYYQNASFFVISNEYTMASPHFFAYESFQLSLLRYVNSVPVWTGIRAGNLNFLLSNIYYQYIVANIVDLEIYSGTFGVSTLPHEETGEEIELYVYVEEDQKRIPFPAVIWTVIYNREERSATAFVTVNNPHQVTPKDIAICEDVSAKIPWLTWDRTNVTVGYSYACSYEDFRLAVKTVPDLDVEKLLT